MWTGAGVSLEYDEFNTNRLSLSEAPGVNQSGRIGKGLVFEQAEVKPNSTLVHREVGDEYKVVFDIDGTIEEKGTELFRSPSAVFYLSDPIKGLLGFARDGYLNTFDYSIKDEDKQIKIEGDQKSTRLYVDDKLIEDMQIGRKYFNSGKDSMKYVRTLVFPLEKSGDFKSKITNLKIYQE